MIKLLTSVLLLSSVGHLTDVRPTHRALDWCIKGTGFFCIRSADDDRTGVAFTRRAHIEISEIGSLHLSENKSQRLAPPISVPFNCDFHIAADGRITADLRGEHLSIGQIELATFAHPELLQAAADGLLHETDASGRAMMRRPGSDGAGKIETGFLESPRRDQLPILICFP